MNGMLYYDPISIFCKIALVSLYDPETKIDLHNNTITIQPPSLSQSIARMFGSSSRQDMYTLLHPVKRFVELTCLGMEILVYRAPTVSTYVSSPSIPIPQNSQNKGPKSQSQSMSCASSAGSSPGTNINNMIQYPAPYPLNGNNGRRYTPNLSNDSSPNSNNRNNSDSDNEEHKLDNIILPSPIVPSGINHSQMVNHLYRNPILKRLLRYYLSGIRALQKTYAEDNAEAALQQAYTVIHEAFELCENGGDVGKALRMLPPSCINYSSSIIDQSQIIELWSDGALESIVKLFEAYILEPLPQNLITCRSQVNELLSKKDIDYQKLITKGSK